jgi:hypothetical protein
MGVNMRFTIRQEDEGDIIDFTKRAETEMSPTRHAVLLDKYDTNSDVVTCKDPNYGDVEIRITAKQLLAMAGTGRARRCSPHPPPSAISSRVVSWAAALISRMNVGLHVAGRRCTDPPATRPANTVARPR